MAKIFWIAEKSGDYMEISAFNNKRKAEEKALELAPHFSFGDNEVPKEEDNEDGDEWLYSGMINAKKFFVLYRGSGMPHAYGDFDDDAQVSSWVENEGYDTAGACFPVKLKGGMGEVYLSSEAEANGSELFVFEDGEVYENKNHTKITNEKKNNKKNMKYVPTFESFIGGSQKLNEDEFGNEDPHGDMWGAVVTIKGTKLKYAWFDCDMSYSGTVCARQDLQALEDFYLDGYEGKRSTDGVEYPTEMWDVYSEYCNDSQDKDGSCEAAQKKKFAPLTKLLKCDLDDIVFFELIHDELDYYTREEYEYAEEKDEKQKFSVKKYSLKGY